MHKTFRWDNHINKALFPSPAETSAVAQQTSKPNAIPHLEYAFTVWNPTKKESIC
jgi:hypothetical protein